MHHQCHQHGMCFLFFIFILTWLMVYIISKLYLCLQVEGTRRIATAATTKTSPNNTYTGLRYVFQVLRVFYTITNNLVQNHL